MIQAQTAKLFFHPENVDVAGTILPLTDQMVNERMHQTWWNNEDLRQDLGNPPPIDRDWSWIDAGIEVDGKLLLSVRIGLVAGIGDPIQGAMLVSTEPVPSVLEPDRKGLFVERLFTAPWNRRSLRKDGELYLLGVGSELIRFAASMSREMGFEGRLLLDSSPQQVGWYQKRGLQTLNLEPIVFEGVTYTPMELSADAAAQLIEA